MAFVFTLLYISLSLLSPDVLPEALQQIHILQIIVFLIVIGSLPNIQKSGIVLLKDTYFVTWPDLRRISVDPGDRLDRRRSCRRHRPDDDGGHLFLRRSELPHAQAAEDSLHRAVSDHDVHPSAGACSRWQSGTLISPYFMRERELVRYRGMGMIADPNDLAQVLVAVIGLLWLRWKKGAYAANIFLTLLPAAFLCYGVFLTHSRGGLLALIAMTLYGFKDRLGVVRVVDPDRGPAVRRG